MTFSRRSFNRAALGASALVAAGAARRLVGEETKGPPLQPFAAQITRLITALDSLGTPLSPNLVDHLRSILGGAEQRSESDRVIEIVSLLAPEVLLEVTLNPEMRVSVRRGMAKPELFEGGWRTFLVKVENDAGATTTLKIESPQGGPVGRTSSLAITGVHDFTNGAVDEVEARQRWIQVENMTSPPMSATLSGLALEYRIVQLYSRDSGQREATLQADAGNAEQDLGFRSSVPILFQCKPATTVRLSIQDERGRASIASLLVTDSFGRTYPSQTKRQLPDLNFEPQVYRYNHETLRLPSGSYQVAFGRGPEYLRKTRSLPVEGGAEPKTLDLILERWVTPSQYGYYSGDTHIHAAGCSHYESPTEGVIPIVMERQVEGEALDLGSVLNWGPGYRYQSQFFTGHAEPMHHTHRSCNRKRRKL